MYVWTSTIHFIVKPQLILLCTTTTTTTTASTITKPNQTTNTTSILYRFFDFLQLSSTSTCNLNYYCPTVTTLLSTRQHSHTHAYTQNYICIVCTRRRRCIHHHKLQSYLKSKLSFSLNFYVCSAKLSLSKLFFFKWKANVSKL